MDDQRRMFLAIALAGLVFLLYYVFVDVPAQREAEEARQAAEAAATQQAGDTLDTPQSGVTAAPSSGLSREAALAARASIPVRTPSLSGSVRLEGAMFDDLELLNYRQEVDEDSAPVVLFRPRAADHAYYAFHGWRRFDGGDPTVPGAGGRPGEFVVKGDTPWQVMEGGTLAPGRPLVLFYDTPDGALHFRRTILVDEDYMFTIKDAVFNRTDAAVQLQHYGVARRHGVPPDLTNFMILHEGSVGVLDETLVMRKYKRLRNDQEKAGAAPAEQAQSVGGWLGFTDKYWLAALIPPTGVHMADTAPDPDAPGAGGQALSVTGQMFVKPAVAGRPEVYENIVWADPVVIAAGEGLELHSRLFAGAKQAELLREYRDTFGITDLEKAIDWGMFWFFTKPIHAGLHYFGLWFGNFGLAILMLTVVVKLIFFPIANMSYKSMARMKAITPKMTQLRERYKDDPQRQQQELIELYRKEKVNPAAGCLPLIPQMIVFFALYKTLFITIEMRHAPFFGWIQDMSAPDPTNIWNLFGLLPYDPSGWPILGGILAIGVWPLLMGLSMAAMQTLNPPPPDPIQAKIFAFMPLIFMFFLAQFAAGLVIYWTWNNILSFAQQYVIVRRQGVDTPIGTWMSKTYKRIRSGELSVASVTDGVRQRLGKLAGRARGGEAKPGGRGADGG